MTSADFCPLTPRIAPRRAVCAWLLAALFARRGWQPSPCAQACSASGLTGPFLHHAPHGPVGQISPDKNVNCRYTTAAFTIAPESVGLRHLVLTCPDDGLVCCFCSSAHSFALRLPSDPSSRRRPCLRLVLVIASISMNTLRFSYRGLSPHKFTPMSSVHKPIQPDTD